MPRECICSFYDVIIRAQQGLCPFCITVEPGAGAGEPHANFFLLINIFVQKSQKIPKTYKNNKTQCFSLKTLSF